MSYVQIEAGGRLRGWKYNTAADNIFRSHALPDGVEELDFEKMSPAQKSIYYSRTAYALFYGGLVGCCIVKREEPDFDFETACEWFDKLPSEKVEDITAAYKEAMAFSDDLPKDKAKKKKPQRNIKDGV